MSEVKTDFIKIDAVNPKPHPKAVKFNSGSVLVGDQWYNVAKAVDINTFQKDNTYAVDIRVTEKDDKKYLTIIKNKTIDETSDNGKELPKKSVNWEARDKSMMLGGLLHDASTLVASDFQGTDLKEKLELVKEAVKGLIEIRKELE